ncbi:hypothetical protein [Dyella sp. 20L07]|uniref:hypothetical protein n=1 Tax=Dyella sp. 20L07 TaxID=3384240 RepID=UPI003D2CE65E
MTSSFDIKLASVLGAYREFVAHDKPVRCRLVHYCGSDVVGGVDVPVDEIEARITAYLAEGFHFDWKWKGDGILIWVQEPDGPLPHWELVEREEPLGDVAAILQRAGFGRNLDGA